MIFSDSAHASAELIGYGFAAFGVVLFLALYLANRFHREPKSTGRPGVHLVR